VTFFFEILNVIFLIDPFRFRTGFVVVSVYFRDNISVVGITGTGLKAEDVCDD
jgi:hypothetical protein